MQFSLWIIFRVAQEKEASEKERKEQIFIVIAVSTSAPFILKKRREKARAEDGGDGRKEITFQTSTNFNAAWLHIWMHNIFSFLWCNDATFSSFSVDVFRRIDDVVFLRIFFFLENEFYDKNCSREGNGRDRTGQALMITVATCLYNNLHSQKLVLFIPFSSLFFNHRQIAY